MEKKFMLEALKEAKKAYLEDEIPIGCVIVHNGEIITKAHNKKESKGCAVNHAEIEAITKATKKLGTWHLDDCDLYVTLEPCMMCTGAIVNSRVKNVYYGAKDPKGGALISNIILNDIKGLNHYPNTVGGIMSDECSSLLKEFFKSKR